MVVQMEAGVGRISPGKFPLPVTVPNREKLQELMLRHTFNRYSTGE